MRKIKNILVTGATGFVGACLTRRLIKRNDKIHIILRKNSDTWRIKDILKKLNLHYLDLANSREVRKVVKKIKPQIIYHLSAYGAYSFQKNPKKIFQTNVFGTINLLNACAHVGFDAFINTGSSSEYGVKSKPMSEKDLLEPNSHYGLSKASQTLLCQYVAKDKGLPIITIRLFSPYGPYEEPTRLIPVLISSCFQGKDLNLVSSKTIRDFNYIDDIIDAYLKIPFKAKKLSGEVINIANGKQRTLEEVVSLVIKFTNAQAKANWGEMKDYSPYASVWQANISKAKRLLNWQARYDIEDGLKKTVNWFRKNRKKFKDKYVIR